MIPIVTNLSKLKERCKIVSIEEGVRVGKILIEELEKNSQAVGLAANQIGIDARVFVMKHTQSIDFFVNPEIEEMSDPFLNKNEGCLSIPGKRINTIRFDNVKLKFDAHGCSVRGLVDEKVSHFSKFSAVTVQHEMDHLDGKLMQEADIYSLCPCGSGKKFKFCHMR